MEMKYNEYENSLEKILWMQLMFGICLFTLLIEHPQDL